jgi:methylenetetrahydrofolate reductase (NADPH)
MKITDILIGDRLSLSFEVFPPKNSTAFDSIKEATEKIAELSPSYMSVTYGAGGGSGKYTLDIARNIEEKYSVPTLAHLTCVSSTKEDIERRISEIRASGIKNVMALRGDIPEGGQHRSDYRHAVELVRQLREADSELCIGGACYPEVHPESKSAEDDIFYLKEKVDAGCSFLTTQMFFENSLYYGFLERAGGVGINVPIIPGVMPITGANQIERARTLSGSMMPRRFLALVDRFGDDPVAMRQAGIAYATDQIIDLFSNGVSNVHVYTMNKPQVAERIMYNLSDIIG